MKCLYSEFFSFVFSRIRTEYGEIRRNAGKCGNWKKTTNDHNILTIIQYTLKINFIEKLNNQNFPKRAHGILETDKIPYEVFLNSIIKSFEILC